MEEAYDETALVSAVPQRKTLFPKSSPGMDISCIKSASVKDFLVIPFSLTIPAFAEPAVVCCAFQSDQVLGDVKELLERFHTTNNISLKIKFVFQDVC
jgi:hypothetical protein